MSKNFEGPRQQTEADFDQQIKSLVSDQKVLSQMKDMYVKEMGEPDGGVSRQLIVMSKTKPKMFAALKSEAEAIVAPEIAAQKKTKEDASWSRKVLGSLFGVKTDSGKQLSQYQDDTTDSIKGSE